MIIRTIDQEGDWTFGKGKSSYKVSLAALSQNVKTKLLEWKGDCFFDNNAGIDWNNRLAKRSQILPLQDEIRTLILKINGITEVINLDLNFNSNNRALRLDYSIKTVYSSEIEENTINI